MVLLGFWSSQGIIFGGVDIGGASLGQLQRLEFQRELSMPIDAYKAGAYEPGLEDTLQPTDLIAISRTAAALGRGGLRLAGRLAGRRVAPAAAWSGVARAVDLGTGPAADIAGRVEAVAQNACPRTGSCAAAAVANAISGVTRGYDARIFVISGINSAGRDVAHAVTELSERTIVGGMQGRYYLSYGRVFRKLSEAAEDAGFGKAISGRLPRGVGATAFSPGDYINYMIGDHSWEMVGLVPVGPHDLVDPIFSVSAPW
jgi:hypothetical protein